MNKSLTVTKKEKAGFLTMASATNIVFSFKNVYYLVFLTNVLMIDVKMAGIIVALGTVWDAINDPLLGLWVANHKFKTGEKVRPLLLYASLPWAIMLVLLFSDFKLSKTLTIVVCMLLYFVFEACYTLVAIPYTAMPSMASAKDEDRKSINAFRGFGAGIGSGIGTVAVTPLVKLFGGLSGDTKIIGTNDARALFLTALVMGGLCLVGSLTHYFTTKERVKPLDDDTDEKMSLWTAYKYLFSTKSWVLNAAYFVFYCLNNVITMTIIAYYASYISGNSSLATPILAVYMVMYVLFSLFTPKIDDKLGRNKMIAISLLVQIVGKIPFLINPYSLVFVMINAASLGIGGSMTFVLASTNRNNVTEILERKSKKRMDSMVASGENLIVKLAEAGMQYLITIALGIAGFNAANGMAQTQATRSVICLLMGWVPVIISAVSLLIVYRLPKVMEKEQNM